MSRFGVSLLAALVFLSASAWGKIESFEECELALGHVLSVQVKPPDNPNKPTFLLMPGINRSILLSDPAAQILGEGGDGVITLNFSVHPFSMQNGSATKRPSKVTLKSLAQEVEAVTAMARERLGLTNIIPVSLSYTGAVSVHLEKFPLIIDAVPLTSARAFEPELYQVRDQIDSAAVWNPAIQFMRGAMIDNLYRSHWMNHLNQFVWTHNLSPMLYWSMLDGYMQLSRAVEDFDWRNENPSRDVARIFVLAANESKELLSDQIGLIRYLAEQGYNVSTVIVEDSGHVLPLEQPEVFASVLKWVADGRITPGQTVLVRNASPSNPHPHFEEFNFTTSE